MGVPGGQNRISVRSRKGKSAAASMEASLAPSPTYQNTAAQLPGQFPGGLSLGGSRRLQIQNARRAPGDREAGAVAFLQPSLRFLKPGVLFRRNS